MVNDNDLADMLTPVKKDKDIIVAEIPVTNTQLHHIATGKCCSLGYEGEVFAVRFLLSRSFKSPKSNYVVNQFIMQIVAVGKKNSMRKEDIAVKTKVKTVMSESKKKEKESIEFKTKTENKQSIF